MSAPSLATLISGIPSTLGSYGPVLKKIDAAMQSPQCNLVTLGEAIEIDPDLTARLLRLANSSFYGFSSRVSTVTEAISLIGIQQVQDLILASSIVERFSGISDEFVSMESFWRHSLACGLTARLLAMELRLPQADKCFVAGMLHDIGRLVLLSEAPQIALEIFTLYRQERLLLREAEQRVLTFDHQQIAAALLKEWNYPGSLIEVVACHHQPLLAKANVQQACAVHVADYLVHALELGSSGEAYVPALNLKACEKIHFHTGMLSAVISRIDGQIEAVEDAFLHSVQPS
ncbi:MAG TPA: HDOD domain-containing protein [Verrucomicrobiae bacterium]|nr:HDOD domain-containing protein [Verrucomicrobiae bacterium]